MNHEQSSLGASALSHLKAFTMRMILAAESDEAIGHGYEKQTVYLSKRRCRYIDLIFVSDPYYSGINSLADP